MIKMIWIFIAAKSAFARIFNSKKKYNSPLSCDYVTIFVTLLINLLFLLFYWLTDLPSGNLERRPISCWSFPFLIRHTSAVVTSSHNYTQNGDESQPTLFCLSPLSFPKNSVLFVLLILISLSICSVIRSSEIICF